MPKVSSVTGTPVGEVQKCWLPYPSTQDTWLCSEAGPAWHQCVLPDPM